MSTAKYQRKAIATLMQRLKETPRFIIFVAGPRQVGKTTLVRDALLQYDPKQYHFIPVDQPDATVRALFAQTEALTSEQVASPRDAAWLVRQWEAARVAAKQSSQGYILILDEIQKLPNWSQVVKGLWDADRAEQLNLHVILLGSSPLLMQQGMTESLAGRYELIRLTHWSFLEMVDAFDFTLDDYVYFGGYPGSAPYIRDEPRWRNYVRESLIKPSIEKDILLMTRVDKPALLKQLFELSCRYSGQLLALNKMLGQLLDAGNTVTLAHYLELLAGAGFVVGLQKYAGQVVRRRASIPKLNVLNPALMSVESGYTQTEAKADRSYWGRMVESTIGAHLYNTSYPDCRLYYWRDDSHEVDFVLEGKNKITIIEVKSGRSRQHAIGFEKFQKAFGHCRKILVGEGGISIPEFLSYPADHWL
jgi:predicted AAA+ superfamily ATPase